MQSYLPDINTKYITYARVVLASLSSKKWSACFGAQNSENALLPEEFQVKISTTEYNKITQENTVAVCNNCKLDCNHHKTNKGECVAEINYKDIKVFDLLSQDIVGLIKGEEFDKVWICPKCEFVNKLSHTKLIKLKKPQPHFWGVVPDPPIRKDGLLDHSAYDKKAEGWVWNMQNELDYKMALFRAANWNKEQSDENDYDPDLNLEETFI